jgi:hypothetical protein
MAAANSKARSQQIFIAAASKVEAVGGVVKVDQTPESDRRILLRRMTETVVADTGCTMESARRNVAKAMRRARYGVMQERWGGTRPGAGRPKTRINKEI